MIDSHITQAIAVTRRSPGAHSRASLPKNEPCGTATAGAPAETGPSTCPSRLALSSIRVSTASASASRPTLASQRGDSGRERRHHSSIRIGVAVSTITQRQASGCRGTTK